MWKSIVQRVPLALCGALLFSNANATSGNFYLKSEASSDLCLESNGLGGDLGGAAFMTGCDGFSSQTWRVNRRSDGFYTLQSLTGVDEGTCLESGRPGETLEVEDASYMSTCQDVSGQIWIFTSQETNDLFEITSLWVRDDNRCLEAVSDEIRSGAATEGAAGMDICDGSAEQRWRLVDAGSDADADTDLDGQRDSFERLLVSNILDPDTDGDGTSDFDDNCILGSNADQADADGDSFGDICDIAPDDSSITLAPGAYVEVEEFTETTVNGLNVTQVSSGDSFGLENYEMTGGGVWTRFSVDGAESTLTENGRDLWSVYLADDETGHGFQFDLYVGLVRNRTTGEDLKIGSASSYVSSASYVGASAFKESGLNGRNVRVAKLEPGYLVQVTSRLWHYYTEDGGAGIRLWQTDRDDWSVYFVDVDDFSTTAHLDLFQQFFRYDEVQLDLRSTGRSVVEPQRGVLLTDQSNNAWHVDTETGEATFIVQMDHYRLISDIAVHPETNVVYGTDFASLYEIDMTTGVTTLIGFHGGVSINSLGFSRPNLGEVKLYGTGSSVTELFEIDVANGSAQEVFDTGRLSAGDLAFDNRGNLFIAAHNGFPSTTDLVQVVPPLGLNLGPFSTNTTDVFALAFADGVMFGQTLTGEALVIDTTTGSTIVLQNNGVTAAGAAPMPSNFEISDDADNDGILNNVDNCPGEPNADQADNDDDGAGDVCDSDDDNDGVPDGSDAFPFNDTESLDTDGDGVGNNQDSDDDGDGVDDANDAFPLDATESLDTDGDLIGNNADSDDDGDGVPDMDDAFPLDPTRSATEGGGNGGDNGSLLDGAIQTNGVGRTRYQIQGVDNSLCIEMDGNFFCNDPDIGGWYSKSIFGLSLATDVPSLALGSGHQCLIQGGSIRGQGTLSCNGWGGIATSFNLNTVPSGSNYTFVDSGQNHSCAVRGSGETSTVRCFGINGISPPAGLANIQRLATGGTYACAIADGELACWGTQDGTAMPAVQNPQDVSVGRFHSCVIDEVGGSRELKCWGQDDGRLDVPGGLADVDLAHAFDDGTCATVDNTMQCWGPFDGDWNPPTEFDGQVLDLAGGDRGCALFATPRSADLRCFGSTFWDAFGTGLQNDADFLRASRRFSDLDDDGMPDAWEQFHGLDRFVQNGDEDADGDGITNFDEYDIGTLPLDADPGATIGDGLPDTWETNFGLDPTDPGDASSDGDGDGFTALEEYESRSFPDMASSYPIRTNYDVSMFDDNACFIDDFTPIACVGDRTGEESIPTVEQSFIAQNFPSAQGVSPISVSMGLQFYCAAGDDAEVTCSSCKLGPDNSVACDTDLAFSEDWDPEVPGSPESNALGFIDGTDVKIDRLQDLRNVTSVGSGYFHTCAIEDVAPYGEMTCWGRNTLSIVPTDILNPRQTDGGYINNCALDDLGIRCWGDTDRDRLNIIDPFVESVSVGEFHVCYITTELQGGERERVVKCHDKIANSLSLDQPTVFNGQNIQVIDRAQAIVAENLAELSNYTGSEPVVVAAGKRGQGINEQQTATAPVAPFPTTCIFDRQQGVVCPTVLDLNRDLTELGLSGDEDILKLVAGDGMFCLLTREPAPVLEANLQCHGLPFDIVPPDLSFRILDSLFQDGSVQAPPWTSSVTPTWTWTGLPGGSNTYRVVLDPEEGADLDALFEAASTFSATSFTPGAALDEGFHTLYVEQLVGGDFQRVGAANQLIDVTPPAISPGTRDDDGDFFFTPSCDDLVFSSNCVIRADLSSNLPDDPACLSIPELERNPTTNVLEIGFGKNDIVRYCAVDVLGNETRVISLVGQVGVDVSLSLASPSYERTDQFGLSGSIVLGRDDISPNGLQVVLDITLPDGEHITSAPVTTTLLVDGDDVLGRFVFPAVAAAGQDENTGVFTLINENGELPSGTLSFQARVLGTSLIAESVSGVRDALVGQSAGYAIVVQGRIEGSEGQQSHKWTANRIYDTMIERGLNPGDGFENSSIHYLGYPDLPGQPLPGEDRLSRHPETNQVMLPTLENLQLALDDIGVKMQNNPAPFFLVMVDHGSGGVGGEVVEVGSGGVFHLSETETLAPSQLDDMLTAMEDDYGLLTDGREDERPRSVILGFCYSGEFIDDLAADGRVIISSAAADEQSFKGVLVPIVNEGASFDIRVGEYFLEELFLSLKKNKDLKTAFEEATELTERFTSRAALGSNEEHPVFNDLALQHPLLEDSREDERVNLGSNVLLGSFGDGQLAQTIKLGIDGDRNALALEVIETTPTRYLPAAGDDSLTLYARLSSNAVDNVLIEIRDPATVRPDSDASRRATEQLEIQASSEKIPSHIIRTDDGILRWEPDLNGDSLTDEISFPDPGRYEIFYVAVPRNVDGSQQPPSAPRRSVVYKDDPQNQGPPNAFNLSWPEDGDTTRSEVYFVWEATEDQDLTTQFDVTYNLVISNEDCEVGLHEAGVCDFTNDARFLERCASEGLSCDTVAPRAKDFILVEDLRDPIAAVELPQGADGDDYSWKVEAVDAYGRRTDSSEVRTILINDLNDPAGPDLLLRQTLANTVVAVDAPTRLSMEVRNLGGQETDANGDGIPDSTAQNVLMRTELPSSMRFDGDPEIVGGAGECVVNGTRMLCQLGNLGAPTEQGGELTYDARSVNINVVSTRTSSRLTITSDVSGFVQPDINLRQFEEDISDNISRTRLSSVPAGSVPNQTPTLFLTGGNINLSVGDTFVEPGFTANDAEDGDLTGAVVVTGLPNTSVAGTYTVNYVVTDSGGASRQRSRTVSVIAPNVAPTISLTGGTVQVTVGDAFTDPGFSANDAEDGNLTASVQVTNLPNTSVIGTYTVNYSVTDSGGLTASATRTVTVAAAPNQAPTLTLSGGSVGLTVGEAFVEPGFSANDAEDGDLTGSVQVTNLPNTSVIGTYTVNYSVTDSGGLTASATRTVTVAAAPNQAPTLTLTGGALTLTAGQAYVEQGFSASDPEDGDITGSVQVTVPDVSVAGSYTVTYTVTDSGGLTATATRTVTVVAPENEPPTLTLSGGGVTLVAGQQFVDPGFTASDAEDGDLTGAVDVSVPDLSAPGTFVVSYSVTDSGGLSASASRLVTVEALDISVDDVRAFGQFETRVLEAYLAYFGRPGDLGGFQFWSGELEEAGGDLAVIINAFGRGEEFDRRFGGLTNLQLITNLYDQLFGREPDPGGRDFWLGELESGRRTLGEIMLSILDGVQGDDVTIVANRMTFSRLYVTLLEEGRIRPQSDVQLATYIASIDETSESLESAIAELAANG